MVVVREDVSAVDAIVRMITWAARVTSGRHDERALSAPARVNRSAARGTKDPPTRVCRGGIRIADDRSADLCAGRRYRSTMTGIDARLWIARESEAFASDLDAGPLDGRVPYCPDWSLRDLAWHLGRVQRFWAAVVRVGADIQPEFVTPVPGPADASELARWMRASTRDLLDALDATSADSPAWTWWRDDRTVGAIARHQVQEVAVHRWDAESVVGTPEPLAEEIADDGLDEFVGIARQLRNPAPIMFTATDSGRSVSVSEGTPTVTVSGPASDLVLLLYGRVSPDAVRVDGDRMTLDAFLVPVG